MIGTKNLKLSLKIYLQAERKLNFQAWSRRKKLIPRRSEYSHNSHVSGKSCSSHVNDESRGGAGVAVTRMVSHVEEQSQQSREWREKDHGIA